MRGTPIKYSDTIVYNECIVQQDHRVTRPSSCRKDRHPRLTFHARAFSVTDRFSHRHADEGRHPRLSSQAHTSKTWVPTFVGMTSHEGTDLRRYDVAPTSIDMASNEDTRLCWHR